MLSKTRNRVTSIGTMLTRFSNPVQTVRVFLGLNGNEPVDIRTRNGAYDFRVRGPMDVWCVKETLLDDVYRKYGFPIEQNWTVVDIGAGFGDFSVLAGREAPNGQVLAFEPFPDSFQLLEENLRRNRVSNVEAVRAAVTAEKRDVRLDFSTFEPLQVSSNKSGVANGAETVPSVTLTEVVERTPDHRIDLLKLDCEGCEYEVLMESPSTTIDRVDRVVMEYHELGGDQTYKTLVALLTSRGFSVEAEPNPVHPDEIGYLRASRARVH